MLNSPGHHGPSVGLSVGATNLAGTRGRAVDEATVLAPTLASAAVATATVSLAAYEQALAWSQDDAADDVLPYRDATDSRPQVRFAHEEWRDDAPPRRAPVVLFGLSAVAATVAAAVFGFSLLNDSTPTPVDAAVTATSTAPAPAAPTPLPAPPAPQAPEQVTTVVVQQPAPRAYRAPQQRQQPPSTTPTTTRPTTTTSSKTSTTTKPAPIDPGTGKGTGSAATVTTAPSISPKA